MTGLVNICQESHVCTVEKTSFCFPEIYKHKHLRLNEEHLAPANAKTKPIIELLLQNYFCFNTAPQSKVMINYQLMAVCKCARGT